jgi:hypothetical protein
MPEVSTKKYRLTMQNGSERTIVMPATWRITFGPNVPGAPRSGRGYSIDQAWCFRVYSTNPKMLKCCIPSVVEFFEEDAFVMELIVRDPEHNLVVSRAQMGVPTSARPRRSNSLNLPDPYGEQLVENFRIAQRQMEAGVPTGFPQSEEER